MKKDDALNNVIFGSRIAAQGVRVALRVVKSLELDRIDEAERCFDRAKEQIISALRQFRDNRSIPDLTGGSSTGKPNQCRSAS